MPELPEVETIKNGIQKAIGNCRILDLIVRQPNLRIKVPENLPSICHGTKIIGYGRRAKYILIHLENRHTLVWHMGMSGKVLITDTLPNPLQKHDHIIFNTENGFLVYNDPRRFGLLTAIQTENLNNLPFFAKLGLEPFDKALTPMFLFDKLQKKKIPVKAALLDQSLVVGIGNIYASEILFEAKVSPLRIASEISKAECAKIIRATHCVLEKAIAAGGSTLKDYEKPDGSLGYFQNQHCVYNKTGQRCPGCSCDISKTGGIKKIIIDGRSTFYCQTKQK